MEIVLRIQRLAEQPAPEQMYATLPDSSPLIGDGRLERAGLTVEIAHPDPAEELADGEATELEYAVEITYEGLYELAEETLADGTSSLLDEHFGALGGWVASTLVRLGDLRFAFLPAEDGSSRLRRAGGHGQATAVARIRRCPTDQNAPDDHRRRPPLRSCSTSASASPRSRSTGRAPATPCPASCCACCRR